MEILTKCIGYYWYANVQVGITRFPLKREYVVLHWGFRDFRDYFFNIKFDAFAGLLFNEIIITLNMLIKYFIAWKSKLLELVEWIDTNLINSILKCISRRTSLNAAPNFNSFNNCFHGHPLNILASC